MNRKKDVIVSSRLRKGAEECLQNAERLLKDANILFYEEGSYPTCFALIILSIEEMAKASKLNDYYQRTENMPKEEWKKFTKDKKAHVNKLLWMEQKDTSWMSDISKLYEETLRKIASQVEWADDLEDFHRKIASVLHDWKLDSLYIEYDFDKEKWNTPLATPLVDEVFMDEITCRGNMLKAEWWLSKLTYEIRGARA